MNTSRRLTAAAALGSVLLCVVAACSSGSGTQGQGALGTLTAPSTNPSAGVSGTPHGGPTVTPSTHKSSSPSSSPPASSMPSGQPSPQPDGTHVFTYRPPISDFAVVTTGACFWQLYNDAGNTLLQIGVEFKITHAGLIAFNSVAFRMTTDQSLDNTSGNAPVGVFTWYTGTELVGPTNEYVGKPVKVTGTITGTDNNASNNVASITVQMPTLTQIGGASSGSAPCS